MTMNLVNDETGEHLATVTPASEDAVNVVLEAPEHDDGRSRWCWIRFANGDLALAVFPQGDTYFKLEEMGLEA